MKKTFIYTIADEYGEIRYVGKSNNPKNRLYKHLTEKSNIHKYNWLKSIRKRGKMPIVEILEEVDLDDWEIHEIYWISQLRSWGFRLLNLTIGGEGGSEYKHTDSCKEVMRNKKLGKNLSNEHKNSISRGVKQKFISDPNYNHCEDRTHIIDKDTLYQKYITENLSLNKCAEFFSVSKHTIFRNITEYNFKKDKSNWIDQLSTKEKMTINQYTLDGVFIKKWVGLKSIQDELGLNWAIILNCCKGMSNKSQGYIWRFDGDDIHRPIISDKSKLPVLQIDSHGKIVNEFKSIKKASEFTSVSRSSIGYCCRGKLKSAGGYIWKYKNNI